MSLTERSLLPSLGPMREDHPTDCVESCGTVLMSRLHYKDPTGVADLGTTLFVRSGAIILTTRDGNTNIPCHASWYMDSDIHATDALDSRLLEVAEHAIT